MYERMLDKSHEPDAVQISEFLGCEAAARLESFTGSLGKLYDLKKELRFPFGDSYGWGLKLSHGKVHLCYAFFERGAFTVTIQIGDGRVSALLEMLPNLSPRSAELWNNRYPCGDNGGWIHYRILSDEDACDALRFVQIKKPPKKH